MAVQVPMMPEMLAPAAAGVAIMAAAEAAASPAAMAAAVDLDLQRLHHYLQE